MAKVTRSISYVERRGDVIEIGMAGRKLVETPAMGLVGSIGISMMVCWYLVEHFKSEPVSCAVLACILLIINGLAIRLLWQRLRVFGSLLRDADGTWRISYVGLRSLGSFKQIAGSPQLRLCRVVRSSGVPDSRLAIVLQAENISILAAVMQSAEEVRALLQVLGFEVAQPLHMKSDGMLFLRG